MRRIIVLVLILLIPTLLLAQFKTQAKPNIGDALTRPASTLLGFLNSERIQMHHTFSISYFTMGGRGMMLNSYMNTINYRISNPLFLRLNLGILHTPYNGFNNNPALSNTKFFGDAELQYRPSKNMLFKLGVNVYPGLIYPYGLGYNRWSR